MSLNYIFILTSNWKLTQPIPGNVVMEGSHGLKSPMNHNCFLWKSQHWMLATMQGMTASQGKRDLLTQMIPAKWKVFCPFPYTLLFLSFDYGRAGRWAGKRDGHGHWIPNARNRHWLVRMNASHKQRLLWTSGRKLAQPLTSLCGLWIFFLMSLGSQIPVCSKQKNWVAAWGTRDEGCYFGHWLLKKFKYSWFTMSC